MYIDDALHYREPCCVFQDWCITNECHAERKHVIIFCQAAFSQADLHVLEPKGALVCALLF